MQLIPARGDQLTRIQVRAPPAGRHGQLRRQLTVGNGQRNPEVVRFDMPAGLRRGTFDRFPPGPRLGRGEETTQPAVAGAASDASCLATSTG